MRANAQIRSFVEVGKEEILIDSMTFPGNSGCPVVISSEGEGGAEGKLIGVHHSTLPYREEAVSRQTGRVRIVFEDNMGLAMGTGTFS